MRDKHALRFDIDRNNQAGAHRTEAERTQLIMSVRFMARKIARTLTRGHHPTMEEVEQAMLVQAWRMTYQWDESQLPFHLFFRRFAFRYASVYMRRHGSMTGSLTQRPHGIDLTPVGDSILTGEQSHAMATTPDYAGDDISSKVWAGVRHRVSGNALLSAILENMQTEDDTLAAIADRFRKEREWVRQKRVELEGMLKREYLRQSRIPVER